MDDGQGGHRTELSYFFGRITGSPFHVLRTDSFFKTQESFSKDDGPESPSDEALLFFGRICDLLNEPRQDEPIPFPGFSFHSTSELYMHYS
jgi:hypothetical protein